MTTPEPVGAFWRDLRDSMTDPEFRRRYEQASREISATDALMALVGQRLRLESRLAEVTSERDRLLVALRSVHCELYEGTRDRAFEVIDAALANQQDVEEPQDG